MSKRMHLIQKFVVFKFLKGDSNPKHFSFFVFYFNLSNKISSNPPRLLDFQEFSNSPVYFNFPVYDVLKNFLTSPFIPPTHPPPPPPPPTPPPFLTPTIRHSNFKILKLLLCDNHSLNDVKNTF